MAEDIKFAEGGGGSIDGHADSCPICHFRIAPIVCYTTMTGRRVAGQVRILYACPNRECGELFIGYFNKKEREQYYHLVSLRPFKPQQPTVSPVVKETSKKFAVIYAQAHQAEQTGL